MVTVISKIHGNIGNTSIVKRRLAIVGVIALIAQLCVPALCQADTIIPGGTTYTTDQTWTLAGSPYNVQGLLTVSAKLTVNPGVVVRFDIGGYIIVDTAAGNLVAEGTVAAPITFTSNAGTPQAGDWYYIDVRANSRASFDYCDIRYAGRGGFPALYFRTSNINFNHSTLRDCAATGISIEARTPTLNTSTISNCAGYPLVHHSADDSPIYSNVTLSGNTPNAVLVPTGTVSTDTTWLLQYPYVLNGLVTVQKTLTLLPGAELRFVIGGYIIVNSGGNLLAQGAAAEPIKFTSNAATPAAGDWYYIDVSADGRATLDNCEIRYAGRGGFTALVFRTSNASFTRSILRDSATHGIAIEGGTPTLDTVTVSNCGGDGIAFRGGRTPTASNLTISNCTGNAIVHGTPDISPPYSNVTLTGNGFNGAYVTNGGTLTADTTWLLPYPYVLNGLVTVAKSLTLLPGAELRFAIGGYAIVPSGGNLLALGTADQGIKITSNAAPPQPGDWYYIDVNAGGSASFDYCDIRYAGRGGFTALYFRDSNVSLTNSTLHDCANDGISIQAPAPKIGTSNGIDPDAPVTIATCAGYALTHTSADFSPFYGDVTLTDNGVDAVSIPAGTVATDTTWRLQYPYILNGLITVQKALTLLPGAQLRFVIGAYMIVNSGGNLLAQGTSDQPITFTSNAAKPQPGDWYYIDIYADGRATFANCDVSYGGRGDYAGLTFRTSNVSLTNSSVHNCQADGIDVANNAQPRIGSATDATLFNQIYSNRFGLRNTTPATAVDARNNYWGHSTGPNHPTQNPGGQGNGVSDGVQFSPWVSKP